MHLAFVILLGQNVSNGMKYRYISMYLNEIYDKDMYRQLFTWINYMDHMGYDFILYTSVVPFLQWRYNSIDVMEIYHNEIKRLDVLRVSPKMWLIYLASITDIYIQISAPSGNLVYHIFVCIMTGVWGVTVQNHAWAVTHLHFRSTNSLVNWLFQTQQIKQHG